MPALQDKYDDAMFAFSQGDHQSAIAQLKEILMEDPKYFDAQLSLGMAYYRMGDYASAIVEGLKAEKLRPTEQLVHTNLSLFYMKSGNKEAAEHHGLQSRVAAWKEALSSPSGENVDSALKMAASPQASPKVPEKFPDMPWKKSSPTKVSSSSSSF